jgi:hypothetical protein
VESALLTIAFLAGAGLVAYGAELAWRPAGFLVGGAMLLVGSFLYARGSSTPL